MSFHVVNPTATEPQLAAFADPLALAYCKALSHALLHEPTARPHSDLIALGYWLRPANIERILSPYRDFGLRPLGHVFHAAPGNVDSLFVYSGILSVLCGNLNTIRLSDKAGGSAEVLCGLVQNLATNHPEVSGRFQIIRSNRDAAELIQLQKHIDGRVLWGSNEGIQALRQRPIPAHARELTFANKLSFAVISSKAVITAKPNELQQLAINFARDNLTFAQQACSSAKVIVWRGEKENTAQAKQLFWQALSTFLISDEGQSKYPLTESEHYRALNNAQDLVMAGIVSRVQTCGGYIRVAGKGLHQTLVNSHQGCGLFVEVAITELEELTSELTAEHQTMSYWGISEMEVSNWLRTCLIGIDRAVPIGKALDFNVVWDGIDLIRAFSRQL